MLGSEWYAERLKTVEQKTVAAMLQMDMIGWVAGPDRIVEIHGTGLADYAAAQPSSAALAAVVVDAVAQVSPGLTPQTYPEAGCDHDPGAHRSDHSSFHYHNWPACLVAEDLWTEVCTGVKQTGNPEYHKASDLVVDAAYAADVTRAVAAAAWLAAL
jgi:Zn-dependent M28 family amino/carboxypeptidase